MSQAFYNGLSGLVSFSKGLNQVSNNISNMNTAGFRGKDVFYKSVMGDSGTELGGEHFREEQGELRQTGNNTDVAIDGHGYFILQDNDKYFATRAGQFKFNRDNVLVDRNSGAKVKGLNEDNELIDIDISKLKALYPEPTKSVLFSGNLSADAKNHSIENLIVYTKMGEAIEFKINIHDRVALKENVTDPDSGASVEKETGIFSWTLDVLDKENNKIHTATIKFDSDGKLISDSNKISFNFSSSDAAIDSDRLEFIFDDCTSFVAGSFSDMSASPNEGHALAGLVGVNFGKDGVMKLSYSNGDTINSTRIALASISDSSLSAISGSIFSVDNENKLNFGSAGTGEFGTISGGRLELANVDLAEEFADMMVIQRGYQASSRVMNVANELIETLYNTAR